MIEVTCAIIEKDDKVLCAQRSELMKLPLKWEFPGGKLETGETLEDCLIREIKEELGVEISIKMKLPPNIYAYDNSKEICLYPFICTIQSGAIFLKEHKQVIWLKLNELEILNWAEADIPILNHYISLKNA
ncbi:(deoxy)nucleoside triphosphate pyrophosphohydrolase [Adhaeribacter rhizoryzae]|uniref:8-oxo-dGTP diphosphatase n=1 Tax=Adhaeribacter rhizoryzae TaxID=2607907 RepID=A0A5M6DE09_9BACT|nr:(deoxy)nucleoside triphosphate pyrophosphohydrolase [Adhaeribacter rhizoryzae]KAA5545791.1 (deoxy)nucleoside triphosphate pyrophosphohydrolase [Adhaeribacter rhizoryzae]